MTPLDETLVGPVPPRAIYSAYATLYAVRRAAKKVARYQQVITVETLLKRIEERDAKGRRKGGVVWHTQGSGKSLTMVMLAKAIAMADIYGTDRHRHRPDRSRRSNIEDLSRQPGRNRSELPRASTCFR